MSTLRFHKDGDPEVKQLWTHKTGNFMVEVTDVDYIREGGFVFYKPVVKGLEQIDDFLEKYEQYPPRKN